MKYLIATIASLFYGQTLFAQDFAGTILYVEAGGLGGAWTVNAEYNLFNKKKWHGQFRVGYGQYNIFNPEREFRGIPISFSFFDRMTNHHKEIGFGVSYLEGMTEGYDDELSKSIYVAPLIAYRFQRKEGGFFLKLQYLPMIKLSQLTDNIVFKRTVGKLYHYPGLAIGYYLNKKKTN